MTFWAIQTLNGVSFGMLLFLLAAGLSLIFGLMRILNLAHGSYYLLGAYVALSVIGATGSFVTAAAAGIAAVVVLGIVMERVFLRRLPRDELPQALLTFGFLLIVGDLSLAYWGGGPQTLPKPAFLELPLRLGPLTFPSYRLFVIGVGALVGLALWFLQERTRLGAMLRAAIDDADIARATGIDVSTLSTGVFAFGAALAALGGITAWRLSRGRLRDPAPGLRGRDRGRARQSQGRVLRRAPDRPARQLRQGAVPAARDVHDLRADGHHPGRAPLRALRQPVKLTLGSVAAVLGLALVPFALSSYQLSLLTKMLIFALFAMSLDLILGYGGLPSLGHAAYFGVGAYTVGLLAVRVIDNFWIDFGAGLAAAAVTSALFGLLALRARGAYLLMITLALAQVLWGIAFGWRWLTGGDDGLPGVPRPSAGLPWSLSGGLAYYYFVLVVFVAVTVALWIVVRSPFGMALVGN